MNNEEHLKRFLGIEGIEGYALVSSDEGNIIQSGGITPGNIDELIAFTGSEMEIIGKLLGLKDYDYIDASGAIHLIILPYQGNYLGFVLESDNDKVKEEILKKVREEDLIGDQTIYKEFVAKVNQISLLLEEFSLDSDAEQWRSLLLQAIPRLDPDGRFRNLLELNGINLKVKGTKGINKQEVDKFCKLLLDFIVKEAIKLLGNDKAKEKIHSVIEKLSSGKNNDKS